MTNEWYAELRELALLASDDTNLAYIKLGRIYKRILDEATADTGVLLVGNFAKTDYLLKEHSANSPLKRMVNDMRLRLKNTDKEQSLEVWDYMKQFDKQAVVYQTVAAVFSTGTL